MHERLPENPGEAAIKIIKNARLRVEDPELQAVEMNNYIRRDALFFSGIHEEDFARAGELRDVHELERILETAHRGRVYDKTKLIRAAKILERVRTRKPRADPELHVSNILSLREGEELKSERELTEIIMDWKRKILGGRYGLYYDRMSELKTTLERHLQKEEREKKALGPNTQPSNPRRFESR